MAHMPIASGLSVELRKIMRRNILIVEDDDVLAGGLCRVFDNTESMADSSKTVEAARKNLMQNKYDLVVLDINLPDGNGLDFLAEIKQKYSIPVIMLTANDMETDIVSGLESGADDYITKPFSLAVLRARVNTQLRKNQQAQTAVTICDYSFDFAKMKYTYRGEAVELSKTEQKLLYYLIKNRGITLSREFLTDHIWDNASEYVDENALSVLVKRLRDKLSAQAYIKTIYGIGYCWKQ